MDVADQKLLDQGGGWNVLQRVHPGRLTFCTWKSWFFNRNLLFQRSILRFHVNLPGCTILLGGIDLSKRFVTMGFFLWQGGAADRYKWSEITYIFLEQSAAVKTWHQIPTPPTRLREHMGCRKLKFLDGCHKKYCQRCWQPALLVSLVSKLSGERYCQHG